MLNRLILVLGATFLLSGCCEVFGICTSVNVHTSIEPPYQLAQSRAAEPGRAGTEPVVAVAGLSGADLLP